MEREFKYWMRFFGKGFSNFLLYKADFLSNEQMVTLPLEQRTLTMNDYVQEIINKSKYVYLYVAELGIICRLCLHTSHFSS